MSNDRELIWAMTRESVMIFSQLFRENAADAAIELLKAHKKLFPEKYHTQEEGS